MCVCRNYTQRYLDLPPYLTKLPAEKYSKLPSKFYIYQEASLNHSGLLSCLPDWNDRITTQYTAEVFALSHLVNHPKRVQVWPWCWIG